ncbi:MAG: zinc-dependent metalloprotease family protein [Saprospiraceae bacterium]
MLKNLLFAILCFSISMTYGQSTWSKTNISTFRNSDSENTMILPSKFEAYKLDFGQIKSKLTAAPKENFNRSDIDGLLIDLPLPNGKIETFEVFYSSVMAPGLAARYPNIKSYKGVSVNDRSMNVRFDYGTYGFHAAIHSPKGIYYIDPYTKTNNSEYIVYDVNDHITQLDIDVPFCGVDDQLKGIQFDDIMVNRSTGDLIPLHVYRFAIACTGEWGALRGTAENCIADMVTGVNRINQIYENELAIRLVLIEDNDKALFFDKDNDPYPNTSSGGAMLSINTGVLNANVGSSSYDLGHVYSRNCDVGGIASLGSLCSAIKGSGVTCHYNSNLDYMASLVTSHEIGHQMSAQHTFNNCDGQNESLGNGYEPGSGSTIMSYGGLCGPQKNVVNRADDYYHTASLIQIYNHTRNGGIADLCAEVIETENQEPEITSTPNNNFTIPEDTYFYLEGSATDGNGDMLTYAWEEFDAGPLSPLGDPIGTAPHFRALPPSESPIRYFPSPDNVLSGSFDRTEVSFKGDRVVNFVFTARDNNAEAGTATWKELRFNIKATPQKFEVTSQNSITSTEVGDKLEVTWNVAETDLAPINVKTVDILFSSGLASEFDLFNNTIVLANNVPNNGSAFINIPNWITNKGRIIVKSNDNIFFAINSRNIQVKEPISPSLYFDTNPISQAVCLPSKPTVTISTLGLAGISGDVSFSIIDGLPSGAIATFNPATVTVGQSSDLTFDFGGAPDSDTYNITIQGIIAGVDTFKRDIILNVTDTDHSSLGLSLPLNSASGVTVSPRFEWTPSANATSYAIEVSDNPNFENLFIDVDNITDNFYELSILLEKSTAYYWRILPSNVCGEGAPSPINAFATEALACKVYNPEASVLPINISGSGLPTIEAEIDVQSTGAIAEVSVTKFKGKHNRNKDLIVSLISPNNKKVELFKKICDQKDFNCKFSDKSNEAVKCPLNNGKTYRPKDMLSLFNGDQIQGTWTLRIEDTKSGNGGQLTGFSIELCSNEVLENPYITKNNILVLAPATTREIDKYRLSVKDNNNSSEELIYTITALPAFGQLTMDGNIISIGSQFSQYQINEGKLKYTAPETELAETQFSFTVIDGEGGWIGITNFDIKIDPLNGITDAVILNKIKVYPNPAHNKLTIDMSNIDVIFSTINIVDLHGKMIKHLSTTDNISTIDVSNIATGMYFISFINDTYTLTRKVVIE